ncbi:hypothetical protein, partial [Stenoxybacter acetivorans]|uniref:hypothetical protein n=1 Tax=Stenoxybacter acetivorans TaxID=422441 RepID=UPI001B80811D
FGFITARFSWYLNRFIAVNYNINSVFIVYFQLLAGNSGATIYCLLLARISISRVNIPILSWKGLSIWSIARVRGHSSPSFALRK